MVKKIIPEPEPEGAEEIEQTKEEVEEIEEEKPIVKPKRHQGHRPGCLAPVTQVPAILVQGSRARC
jgi:hypothetical protein